MKKRIKNLVCFAFAIIAILVVANIIDHLLFLRWIDKYGKDINAVGYSVYLQAAIVDFHDEYHQWPGPQGSIDDAFICELEGGPKAKINSRHINFYKKYHMQIMRKNKFGYEFQFELNDKNLIGFDVENLSPDPKTGLPTEN